MKADQMGILAAYPTQRELPLSNWTRFNCIYVPDVALYAVLRVRVEADRPAPELTGSTHLSSSPNRASAHDHDLRRVGRLLPIPDRTRDDPPPWGAQDVRSDLFFGQVHQARHDGHLLLDRARKVLRGRNGLLDRGRLAAHAR